MLACLNVGTVGGGATAGFGQNVMPPPSGFTSGNRIFQDTFSGSALDLTKWMPGIGANGVLWSNFGRMGYDPQGYAYCGQNTSNTSGTAVPEGPDSELYAKSQVVVNNGLSINCVPNTTNFAPGSGVIYPAITGALTTYNEPGSHTGTSTAASTAAMALPDTGSWYVQIRAKMPDMSAGIAPNVFFHPGASSTNDQEIDFIQGCFGTTSPGYNYYPFATGYIVGGTSLGESVPNVGVNTTLDFHTYGCQVNWTTSTITQYFDGAQVWHYTPATLYPQNYMIMMNIQTWIPGNGFATGYAGGSGSFLIAEVQAYAA